MPEIIFRRAVRADLEAIVDLLADDVLGSAREDGTRPLNLRYIAAFEAIDRDQNHLFAVAEEAGDVIGCLQLTFIPGISRRGRWRGQIEGVRIASARRGQGIGRAFFEWAIGQCRRQGCELVQLTTDKTRADAARFYHSLGFRATHEGMKLEF